MADTRSSPMLPLRWCEPPAGRAGASSVPDPSSEPPAGRDGPHAGSSSVVGGGPPRPRDPAAEHVLEPGKGSPAGPSPWPTPSVPPTTAETQQTRPEVGVRTSSRRRKSAAAFWESGHLVVVLPAHVARADRPELVERLVARVLAKRPRAAATDDALAARAAALADRYVDNVRPASIRWVTNQGKRWGSCSPLTGEIRLSHRLRAVPEWVLDATIVHELAHLLHADHSADFHAVADRYPRQHDALVFLEGYSLGLGLGPPTQVGGS